MRQTVGTAKWIARRGLVLVIGVWMIVGSAIWAAAYSAAAGGLDTTTLDLDRNGADMPGGDEWSRSNDAGGRGGVFSGSHRALDTITGLNLDQRSAQVAGRESQTAEAAGPARKYNRPADRPAGLSGDHTSSKSAVFHRPTDDRTGFGSGTQDADSNRD